MNELQTFTYNKSPVRTVEIDNEPWFVLKDVCDILGLATPARVAERLDEDEVSSTHLTDSIGRKQEMTVISESGLYHVILRSDKPEAKPFRKWVTAEVLPSIRKTGSYNSAKPSKALETEEYHYFAKTLNGEPVITLADFEHFTGITSGSARHALYSIVKDGEDYKLLTHSDLASFKTENPSVTKAVNALVVIKKSGADKLAKYFNCGSKLPAMIAVRKPSPVRLPSVAVRVLMEKVQNEARAIDGISHLLLCPDTVENFEKFRKLLTDRMHKLYSYCVEVAFVEN